jgi:hypothetical protein
VIVVRARKIVTVEATDEGLAVEKVTLSIVQEVVKIAAATEELTAG